jgi:hypothetical protein
VSGRLLRRDREVGLPQDMAVLEKPVFNAARADGFDLGGRDQVLICGIEAHIKFKAVQKVIL